MIFLLDLCVFVWVGGKKWCWCHHHSRNSALTRGVGRFLELRHKDHKNGSMDSKAAWYDKYEYINLDNGGRNVESNTFF